MSALKARELSMLYEQVRGVQPQIIENIRLANAPVISLPKGVKVPAATQNKATKQDASSPTTRTKNM